MAPVDWTLVVPPLIKPSEPTPGVLALAAHLRARGRTVAVVDVNQWMVFPTVDLRVTGDMLDEPLVFGVGDFAAVLGFGARMSGGCATGAGLTGLGTLSTGALIQVTGMFAGGSGLAFGLSAMGVAFV